MAIRTLAQLRQTPQPEWLWQGYVLPSHFTLFTAAPKTGKTTLLFHMMKAIMTGQPCLEQETRTAPILYISEEADTLLAARADSLGFQDSWAIGWVTLVPGMDWNRLIQYMQHAVQTWGNPLIIIDTLSRFWPVENELDAGQIDAALRPVFNILRTSQASVIGVHHNRKAGGTHGMAVRGSTALAAAVDVIMEFWRINPMDNTPKRRLVSVSRYSSTPEEMQVEMRDGTYVVRDTALVELERTIIGLLADRETLAAEEVAEELYVGIRYAQQALAGMCNRGLLEREGRGGRAGYSYSLAYHPQQEAA
jgi:predicted ATP-dependent serine protease